MIKASLVVSEPYRGNRIFDLNDSINGLDNHLYLFHVLQKKLRSLNVCLATHDINTIEESPIIIYNDMPKTFPFKKGGQKVYLLALESIAVHPNNFNLTLYPYFDKVFTWFDEIVDDLSVIKINYSFFINPTPFIGFSEKSGFLCMVSGNKFSNDKNELYTERIQVVEELEHRHDIQFDLYGTGWNEAYLPSVYPIVKSFNSNRLTRKLWMLLEKCMFFLGLETLLIKSYRFYKGKLSPKIPKLREYKFNVCYENVSQVPGYITEKIFDCFFAGCVPVYLGAPNIASYIPDDTFIDRRKFKSNHELFSFLLTITQEEYQEYQENIQRFLKSTAVNSFSADFTAEKIVKHIDLKVV